MTKELLHMTSTYAKELEQVLLGEKTEEEILLYLKEVEKHSFTPEEVGEMVQTIKNHAIYSPTFESSTLVDMCGTGGDKHHTFNISTAASFVVAGAGLPVAKHGNRKLTSSSGSVDVLEALKIPFSQDLKEHEESLQRNNITFLSAQHVYPALKPLAIARKAFGKPTIFNCLGPLTNPFSVKTQIIGCYREQDQEMIAQVLLEQGKKGIVLTGDQGLDEASLSGETKGIRITENGLESFILHPNDVGLEISPLSAIKGGTPEENAQTMVKLFEGEKGPIYDVVILNACLAIFASGIESTLKTAMGRAIQSISSGAALKVLREMQGGNV
ncbi:anthranilate phosphoribosyltransferase [Mangrovibacillus cuniculi]|uniref:Anthranilate phosphoribosyltransferase n=1 Tax=Mangrovibacillus cuniculi TaxID=2593652 RepID=A0A7S8CAT9_9BACI|nr:anthranilate phosphoribosyltransferase [Mangrovibacillus cuniculi]QPC46576.1 anthranilate phosphoribosyltransferase [Mangrovibacillus cuniculi]